MIWATQIVIYVIVAPITVGTLSGFERIMWRLGSPASLAIAISLLLGLCIAGIFYRIYFHPATQIALKVERGDIDGAIKLGESILPNERDANTTFNLAVAYDKVRRWSEAWRLVQTLELPPNTPSASQAALDDLKQRLQHVLGTENQ